MSGGSRYWNEETQRWEDAESRSTAPTTPPPPPRPAFLPTGQGAAGTDAPAGGADALAYGPPAGAEGLPLVSGPAGAPTGSASAGWPGTPVHGPSAAGPAGVAGVAGVAGADEWPHVPEAPSGSVPAGWPGAVGAGASDVDPASAGEWPPVASSAEAPTVSAPVGWPGAAAQSGWPPAAAGGATTDADGGGLFAEEPSVSWPPAGQPATPAATGGPRRRLMWSVLIGAAVVAVAVSLVLTFVVRPGDDDKDNRTTTAQESTASPASPTPVTSEPTDVTRSPTEGTASPSASVSEPPVGYTVHEDEEGFRIAIPEGWKRTTADSSYGIRVVNYRDSDRTHRIQVYQVSESSPDASFDLFLSDETPKAPGFTQIGRETLDDGTFTGSRLEYLADSIRGEPDLGTWHVYDERFVASDSNIYAIAAYGPDADGRDDELELLTTALDWFCPPLGACEAEIPQDSTPQTP
ncbi:hypothetical protein GCM10023084_21660 [Streptomyces lacrimifluminis]|uniref:Uncharacterized protein n=1 Tax=Streptomyces lacrimifluminis TaxID=1500077 RepID=A0A917NWG8_9ACTN|nr:hypothetical protein [Streptomyces lacrimifluminis]GGJ35949.1 hypothetical protein GCM10012282_35870 [Streptomyces lacrimifluminis]